MDVAAYLARIGVKGEVEPSLPDLEMLQRAHLTAVPFENLDVFYRRGVRTDVDWSLPKIIERGRGGWCFELNGAFASLLDALGFSVKRLGAAVLLDPPSSEITHLTLEVALDRPYLVDVGFGDTFIRPLPLDSEGPHDGGIGQFRFVFDGDDTTLVGLGSDDTVEEQYRFDSRPRTASDFNPASDRFQTQPGVQWTQAPFATRLIDGGPDRVTLLSDRIRFRKSGEWSEDPVTEDQWPEMLDLWFGMTP